MRLRKALVVAQVTVSVLLLIGAGLFIRSLRNLRLLDLGLKTDNLIAFNVGADAERLHAGARRSSSTSSCSIACSALPGVTSMAFAQIGLLEGNEWDSSMSVEGYEPKPGENMNPYCNAVSPGYFKTMGIPLVAGRDFDDRDARYVDATGSERQLPSLQGGDRQRELREALLRRSQPDRPPHRLRHQSRARRRRSRSSASSRTPKYTGVRDEIPRQVYFAFMEDDFAGGAVMYVRTSNQPDAAFGADPPGAAPARSPTSRSYNLRTLEQQIDQSLLNDRLIATLSTAFGALATLLAVIGLYGVMAFTVARRTREIGVRMALGAVPGDVVWLVMREVLMLVGTGIVLGLAGAWGLGRLISSQLYGVTASDPVTIAGAAALLAVVALLAGYMPARRATRVNPVLALRYE